MDHCIGVQALASAHSLHWYSLGTTAMSRAGRKKTESRFESGFRE